MNEIPSMISIGIFNGGPTELNEAWTELLYQLMHDVIALRDGEDSSLRLNVVFQIPGQFVRPDFEGLRTSKFSKKNMHLMIQVALPESPPREAREYLNARMIESVTEAEKWAARKKFDLDFSTLRSVVQKL